jgi:hypothetical protein
MVAVALAISLLAILLIIPGWLWFSRNHPQAVWLLALPPFGIGLWLALAAFGIGPQSLGNLVEIPVIAVAAVLGAYLKILLLDKFDIKKYVILVIYMLVSIACISLRLLMPVISE